MRLSNARGTLDIHARVAPIAQPGVLISEGLWPNGAFVNGMGINVAPTLRLTLGGGIFVALGVGSVVIPGMMDTYPVQMRAFFFGLILASVWVPLRMIQPGKRGVVIGAVVAAVAGGAFGFVVTNPGNTFEITREWTEVQSQGESLKEVARRAPSAITTAEIYWSPKNAALREAVAESDPETAAKLDELHEGEGDTKAGDKQALKERAAPYNTVQVPEGAVVQVPRPAHWYVFAAGAVAISAMLLPGISGSYILLILGAYFFILNALKGFLTALAGGSVPIAQGGYVVLFVAGVGIGLLTFARILSYLLHRFPSYTLAALVGLMVGCLRGIWPFRRVVDGMVVNVVPNTMSDVVLWALLTFAVGLVIVGGLTWAGKVRDEAREAKS